MKIRDRDLKHRLRTLASPFEKPPAEARLRDERGPSISALAGVPLVLVVVVHGAGDALIFRFSARVRNDLSSYRRRSISRSPLRAAMHLPRPTPSPSLATRCLVPRGACRFPRTMPGESRGMGFIYLGGRRNVSKPPLRALVSARAASKLSAILFALLIALLRFLAIVLDRVRGVERRRGRPCRDGREVGGGPGVGRTFSYFVTDPHPLARRVPAGSRYGSPRCEPAVAEASRSFGRGHDPSAMGSGAGCRIITWPHERSR